MGKNRTILYKEIIVGVAIFFGLLLRLNAYSTNFPVNDGGMFYVMMKDVQENGCCSLPLYTSYNHVSIPFTYPPIGFLIGIITSEIFSTDFFEVLIFVPLFLSVISIPLFYLFTREIVPLNVSLLSTVLFAIFPRSYLWQIMGGGITRSVGMFFALLSLFLAVSYLKKRRKLTFVAAALSLALCICSHPEWGILTIGTLIVFAFFLYQWRKQKSRIFYIISSGLFLSSFWFVPLIITQNTLMPFTYLASVGFSKFLYGLVEISSIGYSTQENFFPLVGLLAVIGFIIEFRMNKWLFLLGIIPLLVIPRNALNYISIPFTISASFILNRLFISNKELPRRVLISFLFITLFYSLVTKFNIDSELKSNYWRSLSEPEINAMKWVREHTSPSVKFLVLSSSPSEAWSVNPTTEWFPAISDRTSITTAQGTEWLPRNEFARRVNLYVDVQKCFNDSIDCYEEASMKYGYSYDYLYIFRLHSNRTLDSLRNSEKYNEIYNDNDIHIFKKKI